MIIINIFHEEFKLICFIQIVWVRFDQMWQCREHKQPCHRLSSHVSSDVVKLWLVHRNTWHHLFPQVSRSLRKQGNGQVGRTCTMWDHIVHFNKPVEEKKKSFQGPLATPSIYCKSFMICCLCTLQIDLSLESNSTFSSFTKPAIHFHCLKVTLRR